MQVAALLQRIGDRAGITVSLLCGIHCAVLAWALTAMPLVWFSQRLWGIPLVWYARLELALVILAALFAAVGLGLGWLRHRGYGPGVLGLVGIVLLSTVLVIEWHASRWLGPGLVLGGGLLLVVAHVWNATKVAALRVSLERARR